MFPQKRSKDVSVYHLAKYLARFTPDEFKVVVCGSSGAILDAQNYMYNYNLVLILAMKSMDRDTNV